MRKKRILFCSEATFLNTGYATYTREIMKYLHSTGKYELAEMASYGQMNDPRGKSLPWKYYGVQPNRDFEPKASQQQIQAYESDPINQFGAYVFEGVCLDFKPDIVFDIRDFWMLEFAERSPFRRFFNWVIVPTVDAEPQARQWIATYSNADAVFTYSEWAGEVLQDQSGGKMKYWGTAPPSANLEYKPKDKIKCRQALGINPNDKVIGTVMRNQRRKLYPDLFKAFKKLLDKVENPHTYKLYCHTAYPDLGWDIPELLHEYGLSKNVLFTYQCEKTGNIFASTFSGDRIQSQFTGQLDAVMCNVRKGADYNQLSDVVNTFDLYIQYANSEGFGLPQVEAAACGVPVMSTNYSAMKSVVKNLEGIALEPQALYKELETGCMRAVPNNDLTSSLMYHFFEECSDEDKQNMSKKTLENFKEYYQWNISGDRLAKCFDSLPYKNEWDKAPPRINIPKQKPEQSPPNATHKELARWLILEVLGEPEKINTYFESRLTRDLMYRTKTNTTGGMYENESSAIFAGKNTRHPFDFNIAYEEMIRMANKRNFWENKRTNKQ